MTNSQNTNNDLNAQRRRAVQLRLAGKTLSQVREEVGLSTPTIVAAVKAFKAGGWPAVDVKPRGRPRRESADTSAIETARAALLPELINSTNQLWTTSDIRNWLKKEQQLEVSQQTSANYLQSWNWLPENYQKQFSASPSTAVQTWISGEYADFQKEAKRQKATLLWINTRTVSNDVGGNKSGESFSQLYAHTLRGRCLWMCFSSAPTRAQYQDFFTQLLNEFPNGLALVAPNKTLQAEVTHFAQNTEATLLCKLAPVFATTPVKENNSSETKRAPSITQSHEFKTKPMAQQPGPAANMSSAISAPKTDSAKPRNIAQRSTRVAAKQPALKQTKPKQTGPEQLAPKQPNTILPNSISAVKGTTMNQPAREIDAANDAVSKRATALPTSGNGLTHLQRLEAESIQILRETIADAENPVMMYSIGKDSAVMMHLARKAFFPANPPFPLLHVDTTWKFQEMYSFRDKIVKEYGFELLTHTNPEGIEKGVNPFTHGSALHTDIMKTEALKQALDKHKFDVALGGARRDEEKSRAKERVFSFRNPQHRWEPKNQRPELWNVYNTRKHQGESLRVFPLSNWTELDIWQYIYLQNIPIVPLYLAAERPVVERDGTLIMVDDDRMPLKDGEVPMMRNVRFRTLGCYPLTGAVESNATTLLDVIQETLLATNSERQGRMIDSDSAASMEKKKQEGYF